MGDARVVFQFEFRFPFFPGLRVPCQEFFQFDVGIDTHAAEFIAVEFFAVSADTAVLEYNRAGRVFIDPQGDGQKERRKADNAQTGTDDIEDAFDSPIVPEGQVVAEAEGNDMAIDEAFRIERRQRQAAHIGDEGDFLDQGLDAVNDVLDRFMAEARCDDHDMLDPGLADDIFSILEAA